jgi:methanol--5-hydroxybenzimidazolylcobamide Co-methyltransferase
MEGKTSACAHFSPMGNISGACADLWSNESVQNVKLLAGFAPTVYMEQLQYDSRLFNEAIRMGEDHVHMLQDLLIGSDVRLDPQAFILAPVNVIEISREIVKGENYIEAAVRGALKALAMMEEASGKGQLRIPGMELPWFKTIRADLEAIPLDEGKFTEMMLPRLDSKKIILSEYGL